MYLSREKLSISEQPDKASKEKVPSELEQGVMFEALFQHERLVGVDVTGK